MNLFYQEETSQGFRGEYAFLSNMHPVDITYLGHTLSCSEVIYHLLKAEYIGDPRLIHAVANAVDGYESKRIMKGIYVPDIVKLQSMQIALDMKFLNNELARMLVNTNKVQLIEYNWWSDLFWGVDIKTGKGQNNLGEMLMKKRTELNHKVRNLNVV